MATLRIFTLDSEDNVIDDIHIESQDQYKSYEIGEPSGAMNLSSEVVKIIRTYFKVIKEN